MFICENLIVAGLGVKPNAHRHQKRRNTKQKTRKAKYENRLPCALDKNRKYCFAKRNRLKQLFRKMFV